MPTAPTEREPKLDYESKSNGFDPDGYRMTVGEHLEELRGRMLKSIVGFFIAFGVCFYFSDQTIGFFCKPLLNVLDRYDVSTQLRAPEVTEGFMVAVRISMITAAALAGPWMLYQLWQFVAAGLYPHERKYVTKYLPLSIALLVAGMVFVYTVVLPFTLDFFVGYIVNMPMPELRAKAAAVNAATTAPPTTAAATTPPTTSPAAVAAPAVPTTPTVPRVRGVPRDAPEGGIFFDENDQRLKVVLRGIPRVIPFGSNNLITPEIELGKYISLVVMMLISVAIAFQLPLVVLLLERIGIVEVKDLRSARRYVYFAIVVAAAVISPGDAVTVTVALVGPLILLYEFGIWLAVIGKPKAAAAS